jgi:hypothetical protein
MAERQVRPRRAWLPVAAVGLVALLAVALLGIIAMGGNPVSTGPSPNASWLSASLGAAGVSLRYPAGWTAMVSADGSSMSIVPPGADPSHPSPDVSITYLAGATLDSVPLPANTTGRSSATIAGRTGWEADDRGPLPPMSRYVVLPVAGGVLYAQAYAGPGPDLSSNLADILATVRQRAGTTP